MINGEFILEREYFFSRFVSFQPYFYSFGLTIGINFPVLKNMQNPGVLFRLNRINVAYSNFIWLNEKYFSNHM